MTRKSIFAVLVLTLVGCEAEIAGVEVSNEDIVPIDATPMAGTRVGVPEVALCDSGRSYKGFGGQELTHDRVEADQGQERARAKPFGALQTEYPRVLGNTPALLNQSESTYGLTPARWYPSNEPSAVSLYQSYRIAFQGCLTATAMPAKYAAAPTRDSATTECAAWSSKFWGRPALTPELQACADVMLVSATVETDMRRRWAHGCASVLTSSDFLTF